MEMSNWLIAAAVLVCLMASAFFSGSETALTASSRGAMLHLAREGNARAGIVNALREARERLIGALLIGNNVANIAASAMATGLFLSWFGDVGVFYATVAMTAVVVVFCEVLPKTAAFDNPDRVALMVARPIALTVKLFGPVISGVTILVRWLLARLGIEIGASVPILSPHEELRGAVDLFHREGTVEKLDRDMLGGLLNLRDLTVADVMIHRTDVIMANASDPPEKIVEAVLSGPKTRVPLWRDTPQNIVGILHVKDVLRAAHDAAGDFTKVDVVGLARPAWFVPEIRTLSDQLKAFRRRKSPFALVVDEYGEWMGLVTLEDILEEIVGDISDEHDVEVPGVRPQPDGSVNVDGAVPIRDLNRAMDWDLPDEDATTIAGLVIHEARSIPEPGQSFTFHGFRFHVLRKQRNRITALRITPLVRRAAPARTAV
ncbi:Cobalt transporter [Rhodovulum sp. PH10]|uniref:HlyC/CorC family transporter n=1 Tax=Rhodovulum sp. PH10 TaxID=1187851 RepID=UPI00027C2733|nr:HlyC/CorC family transporter [Rhodovulum sp. PH10]EJW13452.1 Cobalt transporter [Rhodovulum sp. PH10]